jgi:hypothetical protein
MIVERVRRLWLINLASRARIPLLFVIFAHSEPARSTKFRVDTRIGTSATTLRAGSRTEIEGRVNEPEESDWALDSMVSLKRVWDRELFSFISVDPTWR